MVGKFLDEGLERIWKPSVRVASVLSGIRTNTLQNTSLERYRYTNPLGQVIIINIF
jgi:hypothetical protein